MPLLVIVLVILLLVGAAVIAVLAGLRQIASDRGWLALALLVVALAVDFGTRVGAAG